MMIDASAPLAEVTVAFHAYERALMADDIATLDALFHAAPTTVRFGVGEVLYGIEAIRAFRKGRGGSPKRHLGRVEITTYGDSFATTNAEFFRDGRARAGCALPMAGRWYLPMSVSRGAGHDASALARGLCRLLWRTV